MDELQRLEAWYAAQCDGEWEHRYGVHIETLDNPGWLARIDLVGTPLDGRGFSPVAEGVSPARHPLEPCWIDCSVQAQVWQGAGDATQLRRILRTFLDWAEAT